MSETIHAIHRARERYGVEMSVGDLVRIATLCQDNVGTLLRRDGEGERWLVKDTKFGYLIPIYSRQNGCVVTFLPIESNFPGLRKLFSED